MADAVIREYRPEDYVATLDFWLKTGFGQANKGINHRTIESSLKMGGKLYLAFLTDNDVLIGTLWITFDGYCGYLHQLNVLPAYANFGVEKRMVEKVIQFSKSKCCQVRVETDINNKNLIELYSESGFTSIGSWEVFILRI